MISSTEKASSRDFDVIIVGAGISGINAAYRIQSQLPDYTYTILEARGGMGGTWDFFKYPGIRSDSDLFTFGFPWQPWTEQKVIADGESIASYIRETAAAHGIDKHVQYHHKMISADWSSDQQAWRISTLVNDEKEEVYNARFIIFGTGYYDYDKPLVTTIPGIENFKGTIVHPQFWPSDLDYAGKRIVIIGSGATAVTLVPSLAQKAAHVTMLQRSPSYVLSVPRGSNSWFLNLLPVWMKHRYNRIRFLVLPWLFFNFCHHFPNAAKNLLKKQTIRQLPENIPQDPHFQPEYNPWEQRLCISPDGDFYKTLRTGVADVATGRIKTMTSSQVILESGQTIDADILITATGLKIQMAGGANITVDGKPLTVGDKFIWKGALLQDLPNAAFVVGYTNASWTLGADATALHFCRILKHMKDKQLTSVVPTLEDPEKLKTVPLLNLKSTYITQGANKMPKAGDQAPWKARANYFTDFMEAKWGDISKGLQFHRVST